MKQLLCFIRKLGSVSRCQFVSLLFKHLFVIVVISGMQL